VQRDRGASTDGPQRLQLREERLRVSKQQEQAGTVKLGTRITEHTETVDVPVREERVVIERTPGSGKVVAGGAELKEGQTIEVPVTRERVNVQKEAVVTEEVNVRKEATQRTEHVQDTVRKEELAVDDKGGLAAERGEATTKQERPGPGRKA